MRRRWRKLLRDPWFLLALAVVLAVLAAALFAPVLAPYDPAQQFEDGLSPEGQPLPPNARFLLGTDLLGRDLLSRLIWGARVSLLVGILANGIAVLIGSGVGIAAGYFRGWTGIILMRFTDVMTAFPALLLAIALAAILKPSLWIVILVIALVNWVQVARVVYAQTLSLVQRDFVEAARALGASHSRIVLRHLVPHLVPTLVVWGSLGLSSTVLLEAALSFLGVGVQPPTPSWGGIINESQAYFTVAPWLVAFPGMAILVTAWSFNLLGEYLREVMH
ncbi:peptide ABC transporter permease [Thermus scotoductus]|jgi:peptide/nickel transport system permease protein|uniref:Peptide ABC transporter permease n=1 Tax=Thermus scotoductus TaxID=37636 RepID=A0A430SI82_THESC|nr:ABC transporter permease [Thermus scotoductus]RTH40330.1 peptide ABC transporter permease [Thermus scotoductus]